MASHLNKGGNLIINSCNAGRTDMGKDLGTSLYSYLKKANKEINILLPRYENNFATTFNKPLNQTDNGWSITSKLTNGKAVEVANSSVTLYKIGCPIEFSSNLSKYLNQ